MSRGILARWAAERAAIEQACIDADRPDLAVGFIEKGLTVAEAKAELERIGATGKPPAAPKASAALPWDQVVAAVTAGRSARADDSAKADAADDHGWGAAIERNNRLGLK